MTTLPDSSKQKKHSPHADTIPRPQVHLQPTMSIAIREAFIPPCFG